MLINRWLSLIVLFVICGCGGWKQKYETLLPVHERTQTVLAAERTAHGKTQQDLQREKAAHGETQQDLQREKAAHGETQRDLQREKAAHGKTQRDLQIKESSLKTMSDTLNQIKKDNSDLAKRYRALTKVKKPLIRDYFELGRVSLEFGVIKEDEGKIKEAVNLFSQARDALKKAIKGNQTSEVHYYLARAYYRLAKRRKADFEDACLHAKKAIAFAPRRKHEGAEALKKKIANCK